MGNSTGYGYVNARIHGMRSYLLEKTTYEKILSLGSINEMVDYLRKTPYREILEKELLFGDRVTAIDRALTRYFADHCNKILKFTKGEPHLLFKLLFWRWELENIKLLIYRIITDNTNQQKWKDNLIPLKGYQTETFEALESINTLKAFQDWLATRRSPLVSVLRDLSKIGSDKLQVERVETAFDNYYFEHIAKSLKSINVSKSVRTFKEMISTEIEFKTIRTALRLLVLSTREKIPPELSIRDYFIHDETNKQVEALIKAIELNKLDETYAICLKSSYGKFLPPNFSSETINAQLDKIDLMLENEFIQRQIRRTKKKYQGIGFGLAFCWQLIAEVRNLRFLSQVIFSDYPRTEARRFLIFG
ncbi:MAG: V-type ATPase subunit [Candidatus Heimdallarchaeota archaeon]